VSSHFQASTILHLRKEILVPVVYEAGWALEPMLPLAIHSKTHHFIDWAITARSSDRCLSVLLYFDVKCS